nr:MAG TPA: Toxin SpoIISA, type II toxin-antitoxin system [Caudoviricetes sp.]
MAYLVLAFIYLVSFLVFYWFNPEDFWKFVRKYVYLNIIIFIVALVTSFVIGVLG